MEHLLGSKAFPLGVRFQPTDEELLYYLKRKVKGKSLKPEMIAEVDVTRFEPWDLPAKSCLETRDLNWFFFCPRSKKYPNSRRVNRATAFGYWKSTGNDRSVSYCSRTVGKIKTLVFHCGKAPSGERTDWVMHEYRLEDTKLVSEGVTQDSYVICKLYQKSGLGPKNGETYGAHLVEEEWERDDDKEWERDDDNNLGGEVVSESCDVTPSVLTFAVDGSKTAHAVGTLINAAPTTSGDTTISALTHAATTSAPATTTFAPAATIAAASTSVAAYAAATTSAAAHAAATTSAAAHAAATSAAPISAAAATDFCLGDFYFSDEELKMALEQFISNEMDSSHLLDDLGGPLGTECTDHGLYMDDLK